MKNKILLIISILALVFCSCEKELNFKGVAVEAGNDIIINALASAGKPFKVMVSHAYQVGKTPNLSITDYYHSVFFTDDVSTDYQTYEYYLRTCVYDAEVEAIVNDTQTYHLTLAPDSLGFVCDYVPQVNDHIVIKATETIKEWDNSVKEIKVATAETTVPTPPHIEVIDHEVIPENPYQIREELIYPSDTIMRLTCRITDPGGNQCYRLRVRGERSGFSAILDTSGGGQQWNDDERLHYLMQDIYFSDDDLFFDSRLTTGYGGWAPFFSTVFDNKLMRGSEYTFVVDSPKPVFQDTSFYKEELTPYSEVVAPQVLVELQAITPELYKYFKSVQLYRITTTDAYSEPIQIFSNVKDGWGIFGGISTHHVIIPYDE
jgi:hypothetical protein